MRAKPLLLGLGGAAGALVLLAALLLFTPPGVALLGRMAGPLSGGLVRLEGVGGSSVNNMRAARVEIADAQGVWLRIEDASLRWNLFALIANRVTVEDVRAARVLVLRRPLPEETESGPGPDIAVARLDLPAITLEVPVIGQRVTLSAAGSLRYRALEDFAADLRIARADNDDTYRITGGVSGDAAQGRAVIREGEDGILGRLAGLPGLGPVNLDLSAEGPRAANRLSLRLSAGALTAEGGGVLRLPQQEADLDLRLSSGAMAPREDIGWESLSGEARVRGRFDAPSLSARLRLAEGRAAGLSARAVTLSLDGDMGQARLTGTVEGLMLPGAHPAIFAGAPWTVEAGADLRAAARPVRFRLAHRLARLEGEARTRGGLMLDADLTVPSLAPFAALEQVAMDGSAALHVALRQTGTRLALAANGRFDTRGEAIPARLLGQGATLTLTAQIEGADIVASQVRLVGAGLGTEIGGSLRKGVLDYRLSLQLRDLSRLVSPLTGALSLEGTVRGALGEAALAARGSASLATAGFARQQVTIQLQARGLPSLRDGNLSLEGRFNDAPLLARATLTGPARRAQVTARWKSLSADADLTLRDAPAGEARVAVGTLSDLAVFTGAALAGAAEAAVRLTAEGKRSDAALRLAVTGLRQDDLEAQSVIVQGEVADLLGAPVPDLTMSAQGLRLPTLTGEAEAAVEGPLEKLSVTASARLTDTGGGAVRLRGAALADLRAGQVRLSSFDGDWRGTALALQAPATIRYGETVAVESLTLRLGKGTLAADGQLMPLLSLRARARDLVLDDFRALLPRAGLQGVVSADAELSGTLALPEGRISLRAEGLRTVFASRAMPAGTLRADLRLAGGRADVDAALQAGERVSLTLRGDAPLSATQPMALRASGRADLALVDVVLAAEGRRLRGALTLDTAIAGTPADPRVTGSGTLAGGEFQDYARGLRIADIAATLSAEGETLRLTQMTARAGPGSLSATGRLDLAAPGFPLDVTLRAERARPVVSDLVTATVSGDLRLAGTVQKQMTLSGALRILEGEINLPERFPPEVAVLNVRRKGESPPPPAAPQSRVDLDVSVASDGPLFVRGRGIEAEMSGDIRLMGTTVLPLVNGAFRLVRGNYTLGGQRLDFTSGTVRFDGTGLRQRLDPTLDFVAQTVSGGIIALLAVTGYASAPRIALSSTPALPQDEVVAHLLFQQSVRQLSPLQLASIAQAAASLGGLGGDFNPLGAVRRTLGLDRLSVGSVNGASGQSQTTVEAGSYVLRNVYVGVRQNLSGGTQTQVQVDVTDRLKAQATVNVGGATAQGQAQQDQGSSIGLSYQLEY